MKNENKIENDTFNTIKADIERSQNKVVILRLAIKGLLGDVSEYVVEKLIEIAKEIASEESLITTLKSILNDSERTNENI